MPEALHESGIVGDDERESADQAAGGAGTGLKIGNNPSGRTGLELSNFLHHFQGHDLKMKVGGETLAEDTARVAAVRDAIGPGTRLMADAVYTLDVNSAMRMARAFVPYDLWFLEAPLAPGDLARMKRLTARSPIPIAGNEVAFGLDAYRDLIVEGGINVVHLDVNQCGGIGEARRIAALAAAFHRPVSFHSATSAVCFAANLHVAACVWNTESVEYHCVHQMLFDCFPQGHFRLLDGAIELPDQPGIGVEIDPDSVSPVGR